MIKICALAGLLFVTFIQMAQAMSVDWAGVYRFEYVEVDRTSLASPQMRKSYLLNHLHLSPKIIAADGVNIIARFDVLPNSFYPDSQVGQQFGAGSNRSGTGVSSGTQDSNVAGGNQKSSTLSVSQLYLNINQEYGASVVGRAPVQFGLGMTYSAGNGAFDHWYDTKDLLGYKFIIGNLSFMPTIAKVYDATVAQGKEVTDVIWNIEYNNAETESVFGLYHQTRSSSPTSNDAPVSRLGGANIIGGYNVQDVNVYLARGFDSVKFRIEGGFRSGGTGVAAANKEEIRMNGYGIALETDFISESKTSWQLKTGIASGDNPNTTNFEGYMFDRNYDVAFLLFNHPMGFSGYDVFQNRVQRNTDPTCTATTTTPCTIKENDEVVDEDTISNVIYFSPRFKYIMSDKWDWTGSFTWAQLQNPTVAPGTTAGTYQDAGRDVGYEIDTGFIFKPNERIQWVNEMGFFFPGSAYKGGSNNYTAGFTYGFQSKAAISF
jgi:hypothetical protein